VAQGPTSKAELEQVYGLGPSRLARFGSELLGVVAAALADQPAVPDATGSYLTSAAPVLVSAAAPGDGV
jgi:hypothetical protein